MFARIPVRLSSRASTNFGGAVFRSMNFRRFSVMTLADNPLLQKSPFQYESPNFPVIKDEHFGPAIREGMKRHMEQILEIANNSVDADFKNTIFALEFIGADFTRAWDIFQNLCLTNANDVLLALEDELAPVVSSHFDDIYMNSTLFARVEKVYNSRSDLEFTSEELRLIEVTYDKFVRAGAKLSDASKQRMRELNEEHSKLTTRFSTNLMKELEAVAIVVDTEDELAGLSKADVARAKEAAEKRGLTGKFVLELVNTTRHPQFESLENRKVRERIWKASVFRNQHGATSNLELVARLALIRAEKAQLLGFNTWAEYAVADQMAKTPQAVSEMLLSMLPAVKKNVQKELADIQQTAAAASLPLPGGVQPWDWEFVGAKVRAARFSLDEEAVKGYMELDRVLHDGVFRTMERLLNVKFTPRPDIPVYHEDVQAWEVFLKADPKNGRQEDESVAIFFTDFYARKGKRGGAWMSNFVGQSRVANRRPVVINVLNVPKPASKDEPTLLTFDEATTIFHELGHGLHGMLSDVLFPSLAMTNVATDFVEFPSTVHEDWAHHPSVVKGYAFHHATKQAIDKEMLDKLVASRTFNQGYDTFEYLSAALLDLAWHQIKKPAGLEATCEAEQLYLRLEAAVKRDASKASAAAAAESVDPSPTVPAEVQAANEAFDVEALERLFLAKHGLSVSQLDPEAEEGLVVPPRYRTTFFSHSMGGGYSASYYAYMWSEILAADAFAFFQEGPNGGPDNVEAGRKYHEEVLKVGNSRDLMSSYVAFRGREPNTQAVLKRRGLLEESNTVQA